MTWKDIGTHKANVCLQVRVVSFLSGSFDTALLASGLHCFGVAVQSSFVGLRMLRLAWPRTKIFDSAQPKPFAGHFETMLSHVFP